MGYATIRTAILVGSLLALGCEARASDVYHYRVERGSELEKDLGYELSIQDQHDEQRSEGLDAVVPIEGSAPDYWVKFRATVAGKLKDLSALELTLNDANGMLLRVPLAIRPVWSTDDQVDVRFPIKKEWTSRAELAIRCVPRMKMHPDIFYLIRLEDYAPGNPNPTHTPTPRSTLIPGPYHVIRLATAQDTGEQVAMLDFKVFKTVEALKEHIAKLPGGSEISFQRWLGPAGGPGWNNKFVNATDDLKKFCAEHHVTLTLTAVPPHY
jgi:hypothetical protein